MRPFSTITVAIFLKYQADGLAKRRLRGIIVPYFMPC
jgi:hypothetical protein